MQFANKHTAFCEETNFVVGNVEGFSMLFITHYQQPIL
jgi:hypothetical protein